MKILVLCHRFPYPLDNGQNLRIFHYVRELRERHTFDLICYGESDPPSEIQPFFRSIRVFPTPQAVRASGLSRLWHMFRVDEFIPRSERVADFLALSDATADWDAVWISGWDMIVNIPKGFRRPILMDAVDDGVLEFTRELLRARSVGRSLQMLKWVWMNYRFERKYFGPADACLFVSERDAEVFARICPGTPTAVIHNGVDVDFFRPVNAHEKGEPILVFEGNMSFPPNEDAAVYFATEILPLIQREVPAARFLVVGKNPTARVRALAGPNIHVTGLVDDVRPYLEEATVFVCPMRKGAGIKNKILQAWAMGKPVVATGKSTGGLFVREGENILVRDDPASFAGAVIGILGNRPKQRSMAAAARATAEERYRWGIKAIELERLVSRVVSRRVQAHA